MPSETRKQKREIRKIDRKARKIAFTKLLEAVKAVKDVDISKDLPYRDKFKQVWPIVKPTLEFAVVLKATGKKFDLAANKIIVFGDDLAGQEVTDEKAIEFLDKLADIWEKVEYVLEILKIVMDDKKDEIIDKVIEVGEWLFE